MKECHKDQSIVSLINLQSKTLSFSQEARITMKMYTLFSSNKNLNRCPSKLWVRLSTKTEWFFFGKIGMWIINTVMYSIPHQKATGWPFLAKLTLSSQRCQMGVGFIDLKTRRNIVGSMRSYSLEECATANLCLVAYQHPAQPQQPWSRKKERKFSRPLFCLLLKASPPSSSCQIVLLLQGKKVRH